uniref:Uncharacterized protein n=1 Tax=Sphaerodactylus townsendi TaxID=933632 RepID=A0ACB8FT59_9SAUR
MCNQNEGFLIKMYLNIASRRKKSICPLLVPINHELSILHFFLVEKKSCSDLLLAFGGGGVHHNGSCIPKCLWSCKIVTDRWQMASNRVKKQESSFPLTDPILNSTADHWLCSHST